VTIAPPAAPLAFASLDEAVAGLRQRGLRLSAARRLVLEALFLADRPVTAEELAAGLGGQVPPSDLASTYRNLETLERHGLVRHVHLGHGPGRYALAGTGEREYLVCERCGALRAVRPAELEAIREHIRVTFGYVARFSHFPLVGLCGACAAAGEPDVPSENGHAHP
jgi:Fur family ferric uptake transcriptional regulator